MAKIDFNKVELNLSQALYTMFVKKLVSGKEGAHKRAVIYFGYHIPRPSPPDSVIDAINEWRIEQALAETVEEAGMKSEEPYTPPPVTSPDEEKAEADVPDEEEAVPPLFILRKHLMWFIRKRVANIYKLLNTTKEEVIALRKKKELSPEEKKRVQEILAKALDINQRLMKKLGLDSDEALIQTEIKKHKTKQFNIRETWLPL